MKDYRSALADLRQLTAVLKPEDSASQDTVKKVVRAAEGFISVAKAAVESDVQQEAETIWHLAGWLWVSTQ